MSEKRALAPAGSAVDAMLQSHELAQRLRPHMAKARWADVVGPQVAAVTQVEAVRDGTVLVVRVKNSVWANELILLKGDMVRRLNRALGGAVLTDIHFKASGLARARKEPAQMPVSEPPLPEPEELARIVLPPAVRARVENVVQAVRDDDLRERIRRTLTRAARLDEWKRRQGFQPCSRCATLAPISPNVPGPHLCPLCRAGVDLGQSL